MYYVSQIFCEQLQKQFVLYALENIPLVNVSFHSLCQMKLKKKNNLQPCIRWMVCTQFWMCSYIARFSSSFTKNVYSEIAVGMQWTPFRSEEKNVVSKWLISMQNFSKDVSIFNLQWLNQNLLMDKNSWTCCVIISELDQYQRMLLEELAKLTCYKYIVSECTCTMASK